MSEKSRFFNSTVDDVRKYNAEEFAEYFKQFLSSGVYHQDEIPKLEVDTTGEDMQVYIEPGAAFIEGYMYKNTEDLYLELDSSDTTNDRIDRIILRLDESEEERTIRAKVLTGTPATEPEPPELTREGDIYELSLAQILVPADVGSLDPENITDERLDEDVCGLVSSLISVPTDEFQEEWEEWFEDIKDLNFVPRENLFFRADEQGLDALFDDEEQMNDIIDAPLGMELIAQEPISMGKITNSEFAMDKITDKEMPMDKVMSRDKFYNASFWVDKGIYNRSIWAGENILTESNWNNNKTFDQIIDDETLMSEFTDSEQSMDDGTDSEIAMDKMLEQLTEGVPGIKFFGSPYLIDTMWSKEMASEKFWKTFKPEPPFTANVSFDLFFSIENTKLKAEYSTTNEYETGATGIDIDFTNINTLKITTNGNLSNSEQFMKILIDGDEIYSTDSSHSETERTFGVEEYSGVKTLELGIRDEGTTSTGSCYWQNIRLEG